MSPGRLRPLAGLAGVRSTVGSGNVGATLLAALSARIIVSPRLRQQIAAASFPLAKNHADELAAAVALNVWTCREAAAIDILRELDQLTSSVLDLAPRDANVPIQSESSIVAARLAANLLATKLGFTAVRRTKLVTAISELARNIHAYAGQGEIRLGALLPPLSAVVVEARDRGPGIADLEAVLSGNYRSRSGLGLGLRAVRSIADEFAIDTGPDRGTTVRAVFAATNRRA